MSSYVTVTAQSHCNCSDGKSTSVIRVMTLPVCGKLQGDQGCVQHQPLSPLVPSLISSR